MLHDIGKLVLLDKLPDQYENAVKLAVDHQILLRNAEKEIFNSLRGDIGAYLYWALKKWLKNGVKPAWKYCKHK